MNHNCPRSFGEYQRTDVNCKLCAAMHSCEKKTIQLLREDSINYHRVKASNPKGYNKYKKNPNPKPEITEIISKETVAQAYRNFLIAKRNLLSKAQIFHRQNKIFLGLDKIEEEFKEVD